MGTNYYVDEPPTCNNPAHSDTSHIGKHSGGWQFLFHSVPEKGLTSWGQWRAHLKGKVIHDEYGRTVSLTRLTEIIEAAKGKRDHVAEAQNFAGGHYSDSYHRDHLGYNFHTGDFS